MMETAVNIAAIFACVPVLRLGNTTRCINKDMMYPLPVDTKVSTIDRVRVCIRDRLAALAAP